MEFFRLLIFVRLGFLMMIIVVLGIYLLPVCHPCVFFDDRCEARQGERG